MVEVSIGWRRAPGIGLVIFSIWGLGVSVGRLVPAAQSPESLAQKLTHICSNYQNVQPFAICQTIFAAKFKDEDWTEAASGGVPQALLDADFLNFISSFLSLENDDLLGQAACEVANTIPQAICSIESTSPIMMKKKVRIQYDTRELMMNQPEQSIFRRVIRFFATTSTWVWKWVIFSMTGLVVGQVFGARYFFWPWVCFPWIWFFKDASSSYILIWYGLGSFVVYDLGFMQYKVSRGLIAIFIIAFTCMTWTWYIVKGNREVAFSLFCFLAVAVPLDPFFDWAIPYIGTVIRKAVDEAAPVAQ